MLTWDVKTIAELIYSIERRVYGAFPLSHGTMGAPQCLIFNVRDAHELRASWTWACPVIPEKDDKRRQRGFLGVFIGLDIWAVPEHPVNFVTVADSDFRAISHVGRNSATHVGGYCYGQGECSLSMCSRSQPCNACPECRDRAKIAKEIERYRKVTAHIGELQIAPK